MSPEQPKPGISGQTIILIVMVVALFLFFIWSSLRTPPSKGYEDIPSAPAKPAEKR